MTILMSMPPLAVWAWLVLGLIQPRSVKLPLIGALPSCGHNRDLGAIPKARPAYHLRI